jgi:hypothetical protein
MLRTLCLHITADRVSFSFGECSVGFGDVYPVSPGGRFITTVAAIAGVFAIAMPIAVLGSNFTLE